MTELSFTLAPSVLALQCDEIHIWCAALDQTYHTIQQLANTLCVDETKRAERFYFAHDRHRFVVGRGILRSLLANYLQTDPDGIQFGHGSKGKPFIINYGNMDKLRFNLSHSDGYALFAFARGREIGVDIEYIHFFPEMEEVAEQFFSTNELLALRTLSNAKKSAAFYNIWTRKEAFAKAIGMGLSHDFSQIDVEQCSRQPKLTVRNKSDLKEECLWSIQDLNPVPGYKAAVAVEGTNWRLQCWKWPEKFAQFGSNIRQLNRMVLN